MNALAQSATPIPQDAAVPLLRTLVMCDLVDSTALIGRLGDQRAADVIRKHDRLARTLLQAHGGREIDKTDGFLVMFDRPIQAVAFALDYQRDLLQLNADEKTTLSARVGVHVGDVLTWDNAAADVAKGAKPVEIEGLVKPITSRLMQLALPTQILLSGVAYSLAHRAQGELGARLESVRWRTHGRYRFKGVPDPIPVFEVGEEGRAPLKAPPWSGKAHREIPFWRRPATMVIESLALFALVAIPAWYLLKPAPAIAFANRDWVVVGDLKNLTGESKFDDSLQTAFRIGLEQSRYVNVLSDLKTRETIQMMRRDPETTAIDRVIGSEVAIRDGARALILPTVAEIGGRVRVTAEVVDPSTQTTVYSESADGMGEQSVLPSLDKVNQQLRMRLGEALATVSSESKPLDRVATKNLEALRAYSLGRRAYGTGKQKEALALLQQSIKLDPDFALARTLVASIYINADDSKSALAEMNRALSLRDRLSARDALYVDARYAEFESPAAALEKWKVLIKLYPDFAVAQGMLGYVGWQYANRYSDAITAYENLATKQNPDSGLREATLGLLYLGQERYDDASRSLVRAKELGFDVAEFRAINLAAQRKFNGLDAMMASAKSVTISTQSTSAKNVRLSFLADQGRWADIWHVTDEIDKDPASTPRSRRKLDCAEISMRILSTQSAEDMTKLKEFVAGERTALENADRIDRAETAFHLLFASYLAATRGDAKLAQTALTYSGSDPESGNYPVLGRMLAVAKAEIALANGKPEDALRILQELPLDGSELYVTHVALMDALAAGNNYAAALEHARWLASHRGRAYTEYNADWVARPFNVAHSDLALLRSAELSSRLGDNEQAKASLAMFNQVWPNPKPAFVSGRVEALQKKL